MIEDRIYYCPACGKSISCVYKSDFINSSFKNSNIIPNMNVSVLSSMMEDKLKGMQYDILEKVLKKNKK